eukprot:2996406-Heterocapsa_arctica.AAC.1
MRTLLRRDLRLQLSGLCIRLERGSIGAGSRARAMEDVRHGHNAAHGLVPLVELRVHLRSREADRRAEGERKVLRDRLL